MLGNNNSLDNVCLRKTVLWIAIAILLPLGFSPMAFGSDHDFELWTWEIFWINLSDLGLPDNTNLYLENANRFDQDVFRMFQFHQRVGIKFEPLQKNLWVKFGSGKSPSV